MLPVQVEFFPGSSAIDRIPGRLPVKVSPVFNVTNTASTCQTAIRLFFIIVRPIQDPRSTQGRVLLNEIVVGKRCQGITAELNLKRLLL